MKRGLILTATVFAFLVFVAAAFSTSAVQRVTAKELKAMPVADVFILDARSNGSYNASNAKIKGAIRIPPGELQGRLSEIPKDKLIITYCT
ncbi:MAG: rhodanese-like domain-containing protein [Thermodesulfobacteriota bacterium]